MAKGEISWKGRFDDGRRRQVYAKKTSRGWDFFEREVRFDCWQALKRPSLEDWTALLDGVERRIQRDLLPENERDRVRELIRRDYPEAAL